MAILYLYNVLGRWSSIFPLEIFEYEHQIWSGILRRRQI